MKWLTSIVLQDAPSTNYYQAHAYKVLPSALQAENDDWTQGQMLGPLPLNSVIFRPCAGELVEAGPVSIQGYASASEGHYIERVEVSSDGETPWTHATLQEQPQPWTWCFWCGIGKGTSKCLAPGHCRRPIGGNAPGQRFKS